MLQKNTRLKKLECNDNQLKTLNLAENKELEYLKCAKNSFNDIKKDVLNTLPDRRNKKTGVVYTYMSLDKKDIELYKSKNWEIN